MTDIASETAVQAISIVLPKEYPLVLMACCILCVECFMMGMLFVAPARFRIFNADYMKQFEKEHSEAFPGSTPATGGFPDAGDGRYAQKLEYKDWVTFNNSMRVHQNFVEMLPAILTIICISGLFLPVATMYVAFINAGARIIYSIMYATRGGNSRVLGAVAGSLPLYGLAVASFVVACMQLAEAL